MFAGAPWEAVCDVVESVEDVKEGPCHNDDVVDILEKDHGDGRVSHTLEYRGQLSHHRHPALPDVLAHGDLEEKQGDAADDHGEEVRYEEGPWYWIILIINNVEKVSGV